MRLYGRKLMEEKFRNAFRVSLPRLAGWDYGSHGLYFVTICTKDRMPYLGEIIQGPNLSMAFLNRSEIGSVAYDYWLKMSEIHSPIEIDEFVIMPDHLLGYCFLINPIKRIGR